uniref:KIF-binding protein n=1 Tax=Strigamia maritima TaxID=126957 RepID=T1JN77_STRMM
MELNFTRLSETFEKARYLLEEESKKDQETEPYKSKYAARELFLSLKSTLKKHQDQQSSDDETPNKYRFMMAALEYYIGVICVDTLEMATGEEHLGKCLEIIKDSELSSECIITALNTLNQLGLMWSRRGDPNKSKEYLLQAENFYTKYTTNGGKGPFTSADLFSDKINDEKLQANLQVLESVMTHTHYYLAQVYSALEETGKAAAYCHSTLKRELESKEFDPLDWSINAATLSQYFISNNKFDSARHHLACAVFVLEQFEAGFLATENTGEDFETKHEMLKQKKADIARCWIKYAHALLLSSKEKVMILADEDDDDDENDANAHSKSEFEELLERGIKTQQGDDSNDELEMLFKSLEVTALEDQVSAKAVMIFSEARQVFLNAQNWVGVAKEYYTLDDHASDYIQLMQDYSTLYKLLAFFEPNSDRQCKMHKRRIDLLEGVLKELNPQYYLDKCRQLKFELGEIYCHLLDTKTGMLRDSEIDLTSHAVQKINYLAKQSIHQFSTFLETFLDSSGEMPSKHPEENERPILLSHFFMGRLYSKIKVRDPKKELDYLKQSQHHFQRIVRYCEENDSAASSMKEELDVCKEMVKLLPIKMEKVLSTA